MLGFESLGHDCEFGLVQRQTGAEPLGLMRFTAHSSADLRRALQTEFVSLTEDVALYSNAGGEYITHARSVGFHFHTFQNVGQVDPDALLAKERQRLAFLRRKMLEDLRSGEKVFVRRAEAAANEDEMHGLAADLAAHGPNTLLWVREPDEAHPDCAVVQAQPGLLVGFLKPRPNNPHRFEVDRNAWVKLCRRSLCLLHHLDDDLDVSPAGAVRTVRAANGQWVGDIELGENGRMRHVQHRSLGSYYQSENILHAKWDLYDSELFVAHDGLFRSIETPPPQAGRPATQPARSVIDA